MQNKKITKIFGSKMRTSGILCSFSPPTNIQRLCRVPPVDCVRTIWRQRSCRNLILFFFSNRDTPRTRIANRQMLPTQLSRDPWTFLKTDVRQYPPFRQSKWTKVPRWDNICTPFFPYEKATEPLKQKKTETKPKKREHSLSVSPVWPIGWALTERREVELWEKTYKSYPNR